MGKETTKAVIFPSKKIPRFLDLLHLVPDTFLKTTFKRPLVKQKMLTHQQNDSIIPGIERLAPSEAFQQFGLHGLGEADQRDVIVVDLAMESDDSLDGGEVAAVSRSMGRASAVSWLTVVLISTSFSMSRPTMKVLNSKKSNLELQK